VGGSALQFTIGWPHRATPEPSPPCAGLIAGTAGVGACTSSCDARRRADDAFLTPIH
jgi:hypothetical protein